MRISFERTGGFAGISKTATIDTVTLPADEAKTLPTLVETADFFNLPTEIPALPNQSDRFVYTVTVEENDRKHTVTVSESAVPANLQPLVEWLKTK
ncbi:MAG: hypothetical protein KME60_00380 [Cyanomargarita calcarea GSE-NOS-MK-12-04C]|jgi:hypothetical protein|uniref:Uncharacterized protein n=1 Tax=Cyanomargarita calcarea GSE-NOS-MK-12-04C TaxID=2839659 RepID=A0A951QJ21_9CYAN|nr:hypothetical protein [Cyanomargarita calcarea GSE-NOS-MK-12-04C]